MSRKFVAILDQEADLDLLWLERCLGTESEVSALVDANARRVEQLVEADSCGVVFVILTKDNLHVRTRMIEELLERKSHLEIVGLGASEDVELVLAAMRAGAHEFLPLGCEPAILRKAVDKLLERSPKAETTGRGKSFVILSPRPDTATSVFATHLALALSERGGESDETVLVDLGIPDADSLLFLDLKPSYTFADALRSVRRFDETLIRTAFARHGSRLAVLPRSDHEDPLPAGQNQEAVALLGVLRSFFSNVVVNLAGSRRADVITDLFAEDANILLVLDQSVVTCRAARLLLDSIADTGASIDSIRLVVDRYTHRLSPDADRIGEVLGLPVFATLPASGIQKVTAMNSGRSIFELEPRCPYARSIRKLAADFETGDAPRKNSLSLADRVARVLRRGGGQ